MRTTVILDDSLMAKLKPLVSKRSLSQFINDCLREHFEVEERRRRFAELEKAYTRASQAGKESGEFEGLETEDWPEW